MSADPTHLLPDALAELSRLDAELVEIRRDLHAHPELSWHEQRTVEVLAARLDKAGVSVQRLERGGLVAEIGPAEGGVVALRADLDALPVEDRSGVEWASTVPGVAHACGHDVHTVAVLGAGLALASMASALPGRLKLVFQPAEEVMPGGALATLASGAIDDIEAIFALHCDPGLDVGQIGVREGALTGAADSLDVRLSGRGGHTSRPHLTEDLTFALGKLVSDLPGVLSRRFDPRAGVSVVWGLVRAGSAINVIPATGRAAGTVRMLDIDAWAAAEDLIRESVAQLVAPYGVDCEVNYVRGVPPVVNGVRCAQVLGRAVSASLGAEAQVATPQSLGGEDFGWYLERVPGAMGRLGTRTPGGPTYDLHQGDLRVDERAIGVGAGVLAATVLEWFGTEK